MLKGAGLGALAYAKEMPSQKRARKRRLVVDYTDPDPMTLSANRKGKGKMDPVEDEECRRHWESSDLKTAGLSGIAFASPA
ncbi:hypothetical protein AK812_SmicGene13546 [Symbiodinium microadriaticum]|uniref:Uncharacterized protein n=1 Tax=Symbiodinium microadriaticum TaxID=2951 RepID=A0A1Q9E7U2_SYMMI|nr:hypothetical protein AK812_SmicGene13546 [Symbiodinium microadriaticum]